MNETIDYYETLGIPETADLAAIKSAYRRMAMKYHPDRGGSHEQMLLINEAFYVLANPTSRAAYDAGRIATANAQAQQAAQEAVRAAAAHSANYPPRSDEIDSWMDSVVGDFLSAKYGSTGGNLPIPTIANSTSGGLFLVIGGIAGGILGWMVFGSDKLSWAIRATTFCAAGGAWAAQILHRGIRASITRESQQTKS